MAFGRRKQHLQSKTGNRRAKWAVSSWDCEGHFYRTSRKKRLHEWWPTPHFQKLLFSALENQEIRQKVETPIPDTVFSSPDLQAEMTPCNITPLPLNSWSHIDVGHQLLHCESRIIWEQNPRLINCRPIVVKKNPNHRCLWCSFGNPLASESPPNCGVVKSQ